MKKIRRCDWAGTTDPVMIRYHDTEWGVPVWNDRKQFEFLVLEGAQAGLSWSTVLHKRAGYRRNFAGFDPRKVARFTEARIRRILRDPSVVRNRLKVRGAVTNARAFLEVRAEFGTFSRYIWGFVGGRPKRNRFRSMKEVPATSPESDALSRDMKTRGFTFVGSTVLYAHMQAAGMVNDHLVGCFRHRACAARSRGR